MQWWQIVLLAAVLSLVLMALAGYLLWRRTSARTRLLGERLSRLPWRSRFKLVVRLTRDNRVPLAVRAIPPLLVAYLALPLDILPDFIPVLGQLDDVLVIVLALGLLTRFVPLTVLDDHLAALEAEAREGDAT